MKISKYFRLEEFTRSDTARRLSLDNTPTPEHIQNLSDMCVNLLDPLRAAWGRPLIVTSGYRGYKLNAAVKGSKTSAHCFGLAADIVPADTNEMDEFKIFAPKFLKQSGLPYDQYIDETNLKGNEWCHFGYKDRKYRQRRQNLITTDGKTYALAAMSKVKRNTCGDCWYYSPWTGDCCFAGAFVDVRHDRPACEHFDLCTEER